MVEATQKEITVVPHGKIMSSIYIVRERKVMVDSDLAELYGVTTGVFNQAVKRNKKRFPDDFMFQLNNKEAENLRSQFVTSSEKHHGGRRYSPLVFTEQGVAMLSSVLRSNRAIQVNIQIMRTFTRLRQLLDTNEVLSRKIEAMENKYDKSFKLVFRAISQLVKEDKKPKGKLGFDTRKKG